MTSDYHHGNLAVALRAAARERLESSGEAELSLRDLAQQVGVSVNACYRHYANKEALLSRVAADGFDEMRDHMLARVGALAQADATTRLWTAGEAYIEFAERRPGLFRLIFGRQGRFEQDANYRHASGEAFAVLVNLVAELRGEPAQTPAVMKLAMGAWALVHGYATFAVSGYLNALPPALRPSAHELVQMLKTQNLAEM